LEWIYKRFPGAETTMNCHPLNCPKKNNERCPKQVGAPENRIIS
jgi:hypothetical protein